MNGPSGFLGGCFLTSVLLYQTEHVRENLILMFAFGGVLICRTPQILAEVIGNESGESSWTVAPDKSNQRFPRGSLSIINRNTGGWKRLKDSWPKLDVT